VKFSKFNLSFKLNLKILIALVLVINLFQLKIIEILVSCLKIKPI
jgi:hypothetical protein